MKVASKTATGIRKRSRGSYHHIHIYRPDHFSFKQVESSVPWHVAFMFLIPVLLAVLQVHYQGSSPFDTHPANMWIFLLSIFIYCFALGYCVKSQIHSPPPGAIYLKPFAEVAFISGSLASAALVSVWVPRILEPVVFLLYFIFLILYAVSNQIRGMGENAVSYVKSTNMWKKIAGNSNDQVTTAAVP